MTIVILSHAQEARVPILLLVVAVAVVHIAVVLRVAVAVLPVEAVAIATEVVAAAVVDKTTLFEIIFYKGRISAPFSVKVQ